MATFYTPNLGDPGEGGGLALTYHIISDGVAVPEPSTLLLLGMSTLGALVYAWRKRK